MTCKIVGNTAVIQSAFTLAKLIEVYKNAPDALVLYADEEHKTPVFKIGLTANPEGDFGNYGISFYAGPSANEDEKPSVSVTVNTGGDKKEYVADTYGAALRKLNKLEESLHGVLAEIEREHAEILGAITVL